MQGWRTVAFQGLTVVVGWLNASFEVVDLTNEESAAVVLTVIAIINTFLRVKTTTPIGESS